MFFSKHKDEKIRVEKLEQKAPGTEDIKRAMDEELVTEYEPQYVKKEEPTEAPLFVKVDKYRDILKDVQEIKLYLSGVKQLMDLIYDVETVRLEAMKMLRVSVQRVEKTITEVDSELLRPRGSIMSELTREDTEVRHIESSLTDLQSQLAELKRELQTFK